MASRRLALNLAQGVKARAGGVINPFRRGLATPHNGSGIKTQTTTLKNGLTVRTPALPSPGLRARLRDRPPAPD